MSRARSRNQVYNCKTHISLTSAGEEKESERNTVEKIQRKTVAALVVHSFIVVSCRRNACAMSDGSRHNPRSWDTLQRGFTEVRLRREVCHEPGVQFGCELCCYYFLQVIFVACIMVGFALAVAGGVLHSQNHSEYVVFVYIGILLGGVSTLLLSIHCYVRRTNKRRQRAMQRHTIAACPITEDGIFEYPLTILPGSSTQRCPHGCLPQERPVEEPFLYRCTPASGAEYRPTDVYPPRYDEVWSSKYPSRFQYHEDII